MSDIGSVIKSSKPIGRILDDVVQDVTVHVERNVTAKTDELELLSQVLLCCDEETDVREEFDAVKMLLSGIVMRFWVEHGTLVEAINAHASAT